MWKTTEYLSNAFGQLKDFFHITLGEIITRQILAVGLLSYKEDLLFPFIIF